MNRSVIDKTAKFVKKSLENETTGHDWWHSWRVWQMSKYIAKHEKPVNTDLVELAALLHDIADWKFNDETRAEAIIVDFLGKLKVDKNLIQKVVHIVENVSFKGAKVKSKQLSREGQIVQDADRLDALGAIGIARCFATGSKLNRQIYDPKITPILHKTFEQYKNSNSTSLNHFHEKLYMLAGMMNTKTGREMAKERTAFVKDFEKQFLAEWKATP